MTDQAAPQYRAASRARPVSGWAVGVILFAAVLMLMTGVFQAVTGLVAIVENEFYVATRNYLFQFDATGWGWIHLVVGLIVALAGWGLCRGGPGPGWSRRRARHRLADPDAPPGGLGGREPTGCTMLGPITLLKLRFSPGEFGRRLVAELWLYPDAASPPFPYFLLTLM